LKIRSKKKTVIFVIEALSFLFCCQWLYHFSARQGMLTIPGALLDAARIDGCAEFGIFLAGLFTGAVKQ